MARITRITHKDSRVRTIAVVILDGLREQGVTIRWQQDSTVRELDTVAIAERVVIALSAKATESTMRERAAIAMLPFHKERLRGYPGGESVELELASSAAVRDADALMKKLRADG